MLWLSLTYTVWSKQWNLSRRFRVESMWTWQFNSELWKNSLCWYQWWHCHRRGCLHCCIGSWQGASSSESCATFNSLSWLHQECWEVYWYRCYWTHPGFFLCTLVTSCCHTQAQAPCEFHLQVPKNRYTTIQKTWWPIACTNIFALGTMNQLRSRLSRCTTENEVLRAKSNEKPSAKENVTQTAELLNTLLHKQITSMSNCKGSDTVMVSEVTLQNMKQNVD